MSPSASNERANRAADGQREANDALWRSGTLVGQYASRNLRPVEVIILARHRDALSGRVLELGCGAGRMTGYLAEFARLIHGIDLAPAMISYCRERYPAATFSVADIRDVATFGPESFDAVVAGYNVLDVVGHADRISILLAIQSILAPGGLLVMSSHNRAAAAELAHPFRIHRRTLRGILSSLMRYPAQRRNRRRLLPFEHHDDEYAILNDPGHDFAVLHYHVDRDAQQRQLEGHGFDLLECLDLEGRPVRPGEAAASSPELHYVARRRAGSASDAR